jgi:hypothetical protein
MANFNYADFQKYNLFRKPSWRFDRVLQMVDRHPTPGRCAKRDDEFIKKARNFVLRWRGYDDAKEREHELYEEFGGLYFAYEIYERTDEMPETALIMQSRLLARQTPEQVAEAMRCSVDTVEWYERLFFNISDRLDARDWITQHVLLPAAMRSINHNQASDDDDYGILPFKDSTVARPFLDGTLKMFAYFGGTFVVDVLISGFEAGKPCVNQESVAQWFDQGWATTVRRRSHQASMQFEINKYNVMELFAVHTRIIEIERSADSQENQRTTTERHIKAMMDDIPWAVGEDGEKLMAGTEVGMYDEMAAELRDDELLQVSTKRTPDGLKKEMEMLALPAPVKKPMRLGGVKGDELLPPDGDKK